MINQVAGSYQIELKPAEKGWKPADEPKGSEK
jgi:hypothetical protein